MRKRCLVMVGSVLLLACPLWGQTFYGSIAGTVTDASGAAIPGATVTLTNIGTSEKRTMDSEATGSYEFVNLVPGDYRIDVDKSGFKHFTREPILVEVQTTRHVDIPMQLGTVSQTVEVTAQTPLLSTQTSDLGQVVSSRTVTEIPLNGRNPIALVSLVPGVVPQGQPSGGNSSMANPVGANPFAMGDFQVGGGQAGQSAILVDGVPTNGSYLNVVTYVPTQDAIQEFKVQTNAMGPEFGRFAGGVINFTTKSGTNSFHGSAYEYLRNKVLDANDFFLNAAGQPVPPFTQNQFGGNLGGPIIKNKLFFFGSYEGYRLRKGAAATGTMPTTAEFNGDFSNYRDSSGNVIPIYDPLTTCGVLGNPACATGANGQPIVTRQQFPGNMIPANRMDPTAAVLKGYFPAPTSAGNQYTNINNFTTSYSTGGDIDEVNYRMDYTLSEKQRLFGRYTYFNLLNLPDAPFGQICQDRCTETVHTGQTVLGDTISFSPTTILDLHLGFTRYAYLRTPLSQGINLSKFGPNWAVLNNEVAWTHIPTVCLSENQGDMQWGSVGWCAQGTGSGIGAHDNTWSFAPSLTKIKGSHTIRAGWEFRVLQNNYYQSNNPSGLLQFDAVMTEQNPFNSTPCSAASCQGSGIASFLLGYGKNNNSSVVTPAKAASQLIYNALYAGDTFQVNRKLTLNLGGRLDLQGNWTERYNRIVDYVPTATSPVSSTMASVMNPVTGKPFGTLNGAFVLVDTPQHPNRSAVGKGVDFSPRIGLAYQLDSKTVIRSAYGIFFLPVDIAWDNQPHNLFINTYSQPWLASINNNQTPNTVLSNPFPQPTGIIQPAGRNQAWINQQGSGVSAPVASNPYAYAQQWNINIQREFRGNWLVDIAYAGAKGTHLPMHNQDLNQLTAANLPAPNGGPGPNGYSAAMLTASVPNPFYGTGLITSGNLTAPTVTAAHLLYPYPQYDDVGMTEPNNRNSSYNAMQLKVEKRFSKGGTVLASYTVSKLISNTNSEINWLEAAAPAWGDSNAYNLENERSLDGFDVPQRFVLSFVQDLPFGKGQKYANSFSSPVASHLVSGWGVDGILTFQSGFPLSIGGSGALGSIPNAGSPRATRLGNESLTSGSLSARLNEWFNTSTFTPTTTYTYGNDSRTEPNLRAQGIRNIDFALFKNTNITERLNLQFRAEFFNMFNRPQFNPPNTSCCGSQFGVISGQYNLPRVIQFGLKLNF